MKHFKILIITIIIFAAAGFFFITQNSSPKNVLLNASTSSTSSTSSSSTIETTIPENPLSDMQPIGQGFENFETSEPYPVVNENPVLSNATLLPPV